MAVSPSGPWRTSTQPETGMPSRTTKNPIEVRTGIAQDLQDDQDQRSGPGTAGERSGKPGVASARCSGRLRRSKDKDRADRQRHEHQGRDHEVIEDLVEGAGKGQDDGEHRLDRDRPGGRTPARVDSRECSGRTARLAPWHSRRAEMP